VIVAFIASRSIPAAFWLLVGALIVFVVAFLLSTGGATTSYPEKRWRGQPLDLSGPSWPDRVKAWLKGRKRA